MLALPALNDAAASARIAEIAAKSGIARRRACCCSATGGTLRAQAYAGGLAVPTLVVADGVVHRLDSQERDAVLGHELAHLAGGRLLAFALIGPLAAPIAALLALAQPVVALLFWIALVTGLRRFLGRHIEES